LVILGVIMKPTNKFLAVFLGVMLSVSALASDFSQTQIRAQSGNMDAQLELGAMYYQGRGVPQDYRQALYWFNKSAVQGSKEAQHNLCVMYENGDGITRDLRQAQQWYFKAANQGS
jgi:TPR repeat protein